MYINLDNNFIVCFSHRIKIHDSRLQTVKLNFTLSLIITFVWVVPLKTCNNLVIM